MTENDSLNAVSMLFGHLLSNTAQVFADVRTFWSPEAVKEVAGIELTGYAENGIIHLLNSGSASLDGTGEQSNGKPVMKPHWEITQQDVDRCLEAVRWCPANKRLYERRRIFKLFKTEVYTCNNDKLNLVKGLGPVLQLAGIYG